MCTESDYIKSKQFCVRLRWISWSFIRGIISIHCFLCWLKISSFYSVGQLVYHHQKCNIRHISYCYVYDEKYPGVSSVHRLYPVNSYKTSGQSIHNVWDISEQITFELTWEIKSLINLFTRAWLDMTTMWNYTFKSFGPIYEIGFDIMVSFINIQLKTCNFSFCLIVCNFS